MTKNIKEHTYYVRGMHCASCEILIEKKLLELGNIKSVEASTSKGAVLIEYEDEKPTIDRLNGIFKKEGYVFSDQSRKIINGFKPKEFFVTLGIGLLIIIGFIGLNKMGLSGLINVSSKSLIVPSLFFPAATVFPFVSQYCENPKYGKISKNINARIVLFPLLLCMCVKYKNRLFKIVFMV